MKSVLLILVIATGLLPVAQIALASPSEIVIEDGDTVWNSNLVPAPSDALDSTDASPENLIEWAFVSHGDTVWNSNLVPVPSDALDSTDTSPENLIEWAFVSHADTVWNVALVTPFFKDITPQNILPEDDVKNVSTMPILRSSEFQHPDSQGVHAASHWRIRTETGNYDDPVLSRLSTSSLTAFFVPSHILEHNTNYYWQVRHKDNYEVWSEWSQETSFTTLREPYAMFEITGRRSGNVLLDASASESRHPDGDIVFYDWDISEDEYRVHVVQETPQLDAWWLVGGTYTVTLTVVDDRGGISTTQQTFDVDSSWFDRFVLIVADWLGYKDDGTVSSLWMNPQDLLPQPLKWYFHGDWIQLDEIDKWLRYGEGERLDWTDIDPEDIVYVLNKEVVQGLTYGECMKLVTEEEEIVHDGFEYYGQRSYTRNFPAVSAFLRKLGADAAKTALTSGVAKLIELPWQIGLIIEGIDAVSGIPSWLEIVGDIKEGQLRQAFGLYVGHRTGLDIADQTWKDALKAAMGDAAEDMEEFEATKAYFESLYNTYEPYYTSGSGPRGYRNQIRQEMKDLICGLVESYRNELPSKQKWYKRLIFWNPGELRLYDANGNVTGLVNGGIEEGIENSIFLPEEEAIALYGWVDVAYAELVGTHEGDYGLSGYWRHEGVEVTFTASNIPVTPGEIHRYAVDWDALSQGEEGVTVDVDSDGDGVFERTITSDSELTRDEFMSQPGCFIATAAYGTPMAEEIQVLREFRDEYLLTNPLGEAFVDLYYRTSPPIAEFITEHPGLKPIVSTGLVPAVAMSAIVVNATATEKGVIVGILVLVSVAVALWVTRRQGKGIQHT